MCDYFNNIDWCTLLSDEPTQQSWDIFEKHFDVALNLYIPKTCKPITYSNQPWVNSEVNSQSKAKSKSWNKYFRRPTEENWLKHTTERNLSSNMTDNARVNYENNIVKESKKNPKSFWKYVNQKHKKVNQIVCIEDVNGIKHYDE
jgi:hypothetical protein